MLDFLSVGKISPDEVHALGEVELIRAHQHSGCGLLELIDEVVQIGVSELSVALADDSVGDDSVDCRYWHSGRPLPQRH